MNKASSLIRQRNEAIRNTFWQHASTKPLMRAYVATALQFGLSDDHIRRIVRNYA